LRSLPNLLALFAAILAANCSRPESYKAVVEEELAKGVCYDSIFHGLHFNMSSDQFYEHSFQMNQHGIFFQHGGSQEIKIDFKEEFKSPVEFVFYPNFEDEVIVELKGSFYYTLWNGFNKEYFAQNLQLELIPKLERWYEGRPFIKISSAPSSIGDTYVKVDGNRQIKLSNSFDNHKVEILFSDLNKVQSTPIGQTGESN